MDSNKNYTDVIIVGAGLSGIGAAHHLQTNCPDHSFTILEGRENMGGTWDLFRYPGIRSDSDMYTLGYSFKPWRNPKAIADGPAILKYIHDTATEDGIDKHIKYNHKVEGASWDSTTARWTIKVATDGQEVEYFCNFLFMCCGYYSYEKGYTPEFEGIDDYKGQIIHPQEWPEDLDYTGKKIVVIGSGATAVTLVPALAEKAGGVTMLQRSPTYVVTGPSEDKIATGLRKILPSKTAYSLSRWKNVLWGSFFYNLARKRPKFVAGLIKKGVQKEMGPDYDVEQHFTPSYNPWDQRLCMVPDSDLFESLKKGTSEMVTDHIDRFTESGILLKSGKILEADIVVTATGLQLAFMGNMELNVDGKQVEPSKLFMYRGMMFSDIPNIALAFGYTNASWTLKCDLVCKYVCRLLNFMKDKNLKYVTPRMTMKDMGEEPMVDFNSGYFLRMMDDLPKQGSKRPWKLHQNYMLDILNFKYSSLKDKFLEYK